jgi:2-amino-4-hydroxy-6-hydroxymethyldihydropteridine diphosphokinase
MNAPAWYTAYLGLGSSLGDRWENLRAALRNLRTFSPETRLLAVSPVYESPHLGREPGDETRYPPHLNAVVKVETALEPLALLAVAQRVEAAGGRQRLQKWGPRTIDVDLLLYADRILQTEALTLPHPGLAERAFVVLPLLDLEPGLRLPDGRALAVLRASETIQRQLCQRVNDNALLL